MAGLHEPRNPHPQIQGIAPGHDPPPGNRRESYRRALDVTRAGFSE
jgi:hypothetical protein